MKCILMCGGYAKRLWPITLYESKPLLKINKDSVLTYIVRKLNISEISEIILSVNKRFEKDFVGWVERHKNEITKPIKIIVEPTTQEEEKFGVLKAIQYIVEQEHINEDIVVIGGDNLLSFNVSDFIKFYKEKKSLVVAVYDIKDTSKTKIYGVMDVDENGLVTKFVEKPENATSTLVSTCCYVFPKEVLYFIGEYLRQGQSADKPGSFLQWFFMRHPIYAFRFDGYWFDIGDIHSLEEARRWAKNGLLKY